VSTDFDAVFERLKGVFASHQAKAVALPAEMQALVDRGVTRLEAGGRL